VPAQASGQRGDTGVTNELVDVGGQGELAVADEAVKQLGHEWM
jgi:hypothetical protein